MPEISMEIVARNLRRSNFDNIRLTDFYRGDGLVPSSDTDVPASGEISLEDLEDYTSQLVWDTEPEDFTSTAGGPYSFVLPSATAINHDIGTIRYSVAAAGSNPTGYSLGWEVGTRTISGNFVQAGTYVFFYTVVVAGSRLGNTFITGVNLLRATITVTVSPPAIVYNGPNRAYFLRYSSAGSVSFWVFRPSDVSGGTPPYTITPGGAPGGATVVFDLNNSLQIDGEKQGAGEHNFYAARYEDYPAGATGDVFTFTVTDSGNNSVTFSLALDVNLRSTPGVGSFTWVRPNSGGEYNLQSGRHAGIYTISQT